jgi:type II secretion system protein I
VLKLKNKGFSLIEALVALGILGFVVISILSGFSAQLRTNKKTREKGIAISLAEDRIEEILKFSRTQIDNMGIIGTPLIETFKNHISSDYRTMRRTTEITYNTNPELLDIKVTVEYGRIGKQGSYRYPYKVSLETTRGGQ